jgi:hypothetical protein
LKDFCGLLGRLGTLCVCFFCGCSSLFSTQNANFHLRTASSLPPLLNTMRDLG